MMEKGKYGGTEDEEVSLAESGASNVPVDSDKDLSDTTLIFKYANGGKTQKLRKKLRNWEVPKNFDVNLKDKLSAQLISIAVRKNDMKMLKLVLSIDPASIDLTAGLKEAAKKGSLAMVLEILKFKDRLENLTDPGFVLSMTFHNPWSKGGFRSIPLTYASISGNYYIMTVLSARGARFPELPEHPCPCEECDDNGGDLKLIKDHIDLLQSQSTPMYMIFKAGKDAEFDPVFKSYEMIEIYEECIEEHHEFAKSYSKNLEAIKKFPLKLLDLCRTMEETRIFLKPPEGYVGPKTAYPRLGYAIQCGDKEFVAHHNVQFLMSNEWVGDDLETSSECAEMVKQLLILLSIPLFIPVNIFLYVGLLCCPDSPSVKFLMSPVNRARSKFGAHLCFCVLLFFLNYRGEKKGEYGGLDFGLMILAYVYVFSHAFLMVRQLCFDCRRFFLRGWNLYDGITHGFFLASLVCWIACMSRSANEGNIPRKALPCYDRLLIFECTFAVASSFASLRLMRATAFHPRIGPIQLALSRMYDNTKNFLIFFILTFLTFAVGIRILVRPYQNVVNLDDEGKPMDQPTGDLLNLPALAMKIFGDGIDRGDMELLIPNASYKVDGREEFAENPQQTTQVLLYIICIVYGALHGCLNDIFTGFFGNTAEDIQKAKEVEWKFFRVQEMLWHIHDSRLAPPINMLPNRPCCQQMCPCCESSDDVESHGKLEYNRNQYAILLRKLFQRYLQSEQSSNDHKNPKATDVTTVHTSIKQVRELIKTAIKSQEKEKEMMRRRKSESEEEETI